MNIDDLIRSINNSYEHLKDKVERQPQRLQALSDNSQQQLKRAQLKRQKQQQQLNIAEFQRLYRQLQPELFSYSKDDLTESPANTLLAGVYHHDVQFIDPFHQLRGLDELNAYFAALYQNLESIEFTFLHHWNTPRQPENTAPTLLDNVQNPEQNPEKNPEQPCDNTSRQRQLSFQRWQLRFRHPRLAAGKEIHLEGGSELTWQDNKIIIQRDFFDSSQMLYQHLPVLGFTLNQIKRRMV